MADTNVPDPFSSDSLLPPPRNTAKPVKKAKTKSKVITFEDWLNSTEGKKTSQLMPLLEVLSQGHAIRSQLAFIARLQTAFEAGRGA